MHCFGKWNMLKLNLAFFFSCFLWRDARFYFITDQVWSYFSLAALITRKLRACISLSSTSQREQLWIVTSCKHYRCEQNKIPSEHSSRQPREPSDAVSFDRICHRENTKTKHKSIPSSKYENVKFGLFLEFSNKDDFKNFDRDWS